jgi:IstB-like ATP binding protein
MFVVQLAALMRSSPTTPVGRAIETICRNDLIIDEIGFAPLDHTGSQLLFRLVAAAYERRSLAIGSHSPFEHWGHGQVLVGLLVLDLIERHRNQPIEQIDPTQGFGGDADTHVVDRPPRGPVAVRGGLLVADDACRAHGTRATVDPHDEHTGHSLAPSPTEA